MTTTDTNDSELALQDEDRLPWLEAVDNDDEDEGVSTAKLAGFVIAALLALAVVVGGVWWLRGQKQDPAGDGTLIAAKEGDYKVKPDEAGGMKVEGQGDAAFAASEGAEANGKIAASPGFETPVTPNRVAPPAPSPAAPAKSSVTAAVVSGGSVSPKTPVARPAPAPPPAAGAGTGLIQLGAYNSEASANQAWGVLSRKHSVLASLPKSVVSATVGGTNFYRLRAQAGAKAGDVCATLKAGGANCIVVK